MARTAAIVSVVALITFSALSAQANSWERHVKNQLDRALSLLPGQGSSLVVRRIGMLNGEEKESFGADVEAGKSYSVIGVCDQDCTDLSLIIVDENGSELAIDETRDNVPIIQFTPRVTAHYRVRVVMGACQVNPCWYAAAVTRNSP